MVTKEEAKEKVKELVKEFLEYSKERLDKKSENQIQSEFIDPLFEALGWDMRKDAEREERVLRGRADYILKIGNKESLVIEAKKTDVSLLEDQGRQAVSYAYHRKIKFSVLTNFKYIRVYHALSNIKNIDKNLLKKDGAYFILEVKEFLDKFDLLWLLSKESFEKEEINKLLSAKDERLAKPIDETILVDLLEIRELLSKDLKKLRNYLGDEKIDEAIQILINRFIFMRSVEDRGLENKNFLLGIRKDFREGRLRKRLWDALEIQFKIFNKMYNSKLFAPSILEDEKDIFFDDDTLDKIIWILYFGTKGQQARYMFDQIPSDLLGSIYEQYLGTILRGTDKRVRLEAGTGKRKKMGIYYTPSYIVDYIVKNTVGEYIKDKSIDKILEVKVVDPACGSGSFLIRAFQEICNVIEEKLRKGEKAEKYEHAFQEWKGKLSLGEKATILTNCIYGVDLDEKAVELAELNLLLKILEEEGRDVPNKRLPNLFNNIKCGNSLISDSRYDKAFNWNAQFPEVFKNGGFDIVVGNPPYIKEYVNRKIFEKVKKSNSKVAKYYQGKMDFWYFFSCLSLDIMKEKGLHSFIAQNNWITSAGASKLRNKILSESKIIKFTDFNDFKVFEDAGIQTMIYVLEKSKPPTEYTIEYSKINEKVSESELNQFLSQGKLNSKITKFETKIKPIELIDKTITFSSSELFNILNKIKEQSNYSFDSKEISTGIDIHQDFINEKHLSILKSNQIKKGEGIFVINTKEKNSLELTKKEEEIIKPYYTTKELSRYFLNKNNSLWVIYSDINVRKNINDYPNIKKHLDKFKKIITSDFAPYGLHRAREQIFFEGEKIISLRKTSEPNFTYTDFPCYVSQTYFVIKTNKIDMRALSGLLNSKLIHFWLEYKGKKQGKLLQVDKEPLLNLPVKIPDEKQTKRIKELVERIMEFYKKGKSEQQIKNVDYEIDEEIYKLYGLTLEEIKIVEESLK